MDWIILLNAIGIFVFAISGVLTAIDKGFDLVGSAIIGFATALGGGTVRDIMIGETPVTWMHNPSYLLLILGAIICSYFFENRIMKLKKGMFIFDTIGIGLFTILGLQKALDLGLSAPVSLLMGVVTAVFGGVLRDVLCNEIPLIFRKEIYASACLAGGLMFLILQFFDMHIELNMIVSIFVVFAIRYLSIKLKWSLNFNSDNG